MHNYRIAPAAAADLRAIGRYTTDTWGPAQARRYRSALGRCLVAIAAGTARSTRPIPDLPELRCTRCEHHFIFSLHRDAELPAFIAVLHENMDLMAHLAQRLAKNF